MEIPIGVASAYFLGKEAQIHLRDRAERKKFAEDYDNVNKHYEKEDLTKQKRIAYHEAGHILVSILKLGSSIATHITLKPGEDYLGGVKNIGPADRSIETKIQYENDILCFMAGRAAEELIMGSDQYSIGAQNDLERAYDTATQMITEYGMSDEIGPVVNPNRQSESFLERVFLGKIAPQSEEMTMRIEHERESILKTKLQEAKTFLQENKASLDNIANALLDKEELSADEAKALIVDIPEENIPKPDINQI